MDRGNKYSPQRTQRTQRVLIFLCVPPLFLESFQKIIKSLTIILIIVTATVITL